MSEVEIVAGSRRSVDEMLMDLDEAQLRELYEKIWERLKVMDNIKQAQALAGFRVGERVVFMHHGERVAGTVTKLNRRTVGVHTDNHRNWKVVPALLSQLIEK